jgi:hypothetical protein
MLNYFIITEAGLILPIDFCAIVATREEDITEEQAKAAWESSCSLCVNTDIWDITSSGDILMQPKDQYIIEQERQYE